MAIGNQEPSNNAVEVFSGASSSVVLPNEPGVYYVKFSATGNSGNPVALDVPDNLLAISTSSMEMSGGTHSFGSFDSQGSAKVVSDGVNLTFTAYETFTLGGVSQRQVETLTQIWKK